MYAQTPRVPATPTAAMPSGVTMIAMGQCDVCGNDYQATFDVLTADGGRHRFDSFECAIQRLAPRCGQCGILIIGHGVQLNDSIFCCAHCARMAEPDAGGLLTDSVTPGE